MLHSPSHLPLQACKQQFREEVTAGGKGPWRPCSYCRCESQKTFHSHYGGRVEEFCRPHCMSQYTVLFYGVGGALGSATALPIGQMTQRCFCFFWIHLRNMFLIVPVIYGGKKGKAVPNLFGQMS